MPLYIGRSKNFSQVFLCGDLGPHCAMCDSGSEYLCDYPVGKGKTCDLPLCAEHAKEIAPNLHYCPGHFILWERFSESGAVNLGARK